MGKRIEENDILIPALRIIRDNPNCNTSFIKDKLMEEVVLSDEDMEILANRNDTKFSQIVRNLVSHYDNNEFGKSTIRKSINNHYRFTINQHGITLINKHDTENFNAEVDDLMQSEQVQHEKEYTDITDINNANNRLPEFRETAKRKRYLTDPRLSKTALIKCNYLCEYASLFNLNHETFDAVKGNKYLEGHHLIPMKAQIDFGDKNLDRVENIVGLCPICHAAVHYGTLQEKVRVLRPLYDKRIKLLNECEHEIDITFEDLINKYYL